MRVRLAVVTVLTLAAAAVVVPPAFACSCAEPTVGDLARRHPGLAIAVVRRIDRDGGAAGVGHVERALRGALPEQVPLALDDGGSCRPYVGVGQLATLAFEPVGDSWRTVDCGMLDAASTFGEAFGAVQVDPDARGDPAVLLAGGLPGADLVLLDSDLRVLATRSLRAHIGSVRRCGDAILVDAMRRDRTVLVRVSLPDLEVLDERELKGDPDYERLLDVRCGKGRVTAVTRSEGEARPTLTAYRDLFGAAEGEVLPVAEDAAVVGDKVLLLRSSNDARSSALHAYDLSTGDTALRRTFNGMSASEMTVSPDGAHLVVRGYAEESVVLVLRTATAQTIGRSTGSWMPLTSPWVDAGRLLLIDENRSMGAPPSAARVVDVGMNRIGEVPPLPTATLVAADGMVAGVGGAEVTVITEDGQLRTSDDPRTAAAWDAVLLGPVESGNGVAPLPAVDPGVAARAAFDVRRWVVGGAALLLLVLLVSVAIRRRRVRT